MVAGRAMVEYLAKHRELYEKANSLWEAFRRDVDRLCQEVGLPCWTTGAGTMSGAHFTRVRPRNAREVHELRWSRSIEHVLNLYARLRGVLYVSERLVHLLPSLVHSEEEVRLFRTTLESFLAEVAKR
jgi:glutamate-1-semialdehyde aminotransferase